MTDTEIIKALESYINDISCLQCGAKDKYLLTTIDSTLDLIKRQKAEIERVEYALLGVMHSVDKWLDGDELKQGEVERAATMREKTLQIVEEKAAEIERLNDIRAELSKEIERLRELVEECVDSNEAWVRDNGELRNKLTTAQAEIERLKIILDAYALQHGTVRICEAKMHGEERG